MLISHRHKYLFFAVPKTASTSICQALMEKGGAEIIPPKHKYAREARSDLPHHIWSDYFKFAFVRNPFDWMVSWYFYRSQDMFHDGRNPHHSFTGDVPFCDFIRFDTEWPRTQSEFLTDERGVWLMNFVGRYEHLQEDFDAVCRELGIRQIRLPFMNTSSNKGNQKTLYDEDLTQIITERDRLIVDRFGYRPDDPRGARLPLSQHLRLQLRNLRRRLQ